MIAQVQSVLCQSCGAGISVPDDIARLNCAHCGTPLSIVRGDGYIATKLANQVSHSIEASGAATQSELRRMQNQQERLTIQSRIGQLEAEERSVRAQPRNARTKRHLAEVQGQWNEMVYRLNVVEDALGLTHSYIPKAPHYSPNALRPIWGNILMVLAGVVALISLANNQMLAMMMALVVVVVMYYSGTMLARNKQ